jgi:hypothetical protein
MSSNPLVKALRQQLSPPQFVHGPWQWGVVHAVNAGPPPSVDLYLDGTQTLGDTSYLTHAVRYVASYNPAVGDIVLVSRGTGGLRTDRVVLGPLRAEPRTNTYTASATASVGETSICTASLTLTLPSAPPNGTTNTVVATSGVVTIDAGGSDTITWGSSGETSVQIAPGMSLTVVYSGGVWYASQTNGDVPAGRMYGSSASIGTSPSQVAMTEDFAYGGVTVASSAITVPVAGIYKVNAAIAFYDSSTTSYYCLLYQNGSNVRGWYTGQTGQLIATAGGSDLIKCAANDVFTLYGQVGTGSGVGLFGGGIGTYVSLALMT